MQSITEILLSIPQPDLRHCFQMGYECEMSGANTTNCHFSIFSTKERMQAWEAGKKQAAQVKESAQQGVQRTALPGEVISDFSSDADFRIESEGE